MPLQDHGRDNRSPHLPRMARVSGPGPDKAEQHVLNNKARLKGMSQACKAGPAPHQVLPPFASGTLLASPGCVLLPGGWPCHGRCNDSMPTLLMGCAALVPWWPYVGGCRRLAHRGRRILTGRATATGSLKGRGPGGQERKVPRAVRPWWELIGEGPEKEAVQCWNSSVESAESGPL